MVCLVAGGGVQKAMTLDPATMVQVGVAAALTLGGLVLGLVASRWLVPRLTRSALTTRSNADDVLLAAVRGPVVLWVTMLGVYLATELTDLPPALSVVLQRVLMVLLIVSVTWSLSRAAFAIVATRARVLGKPPTVALISNMVRLIVLVIGALVVLQTLGISITPVITALGVGGLAAGLALQDTLANLFAGIHILAARQVRRGDFVRLESGEEGYIEDITWRYTTIRQLSNSLTVVPNAKLASAIVTNFYLPNPELAVLVTLTISQGSDLEQVEAVCVAVAKETMGRVQGAVRGFEPFVRYGKFAPAGIECTVILRGREYVDQYLLRHEFIKALHRRLESDGIELAKLPLLQQAPRS